MKGGVFMSKSIHIREAKISDFKIIYELNKSALGYDYPDDTTKERLELILKRPTDRVFIAEYGGEAAGYIHGSDYECLYCDSLKNIMALAVDEKFRGHGIGRKLLAAAEAWAAMSGSAGVRLTSGFERTEAHEFYKHCGYLLRKEQKNFLKLFFRPAAFERIIIKGL
jgi:GNAT superfamily N-acetyltransferase